MAKIAEQALGGEYTVTVQPYPVADRRHEGRDGWRRRDRLHRRHRHDPVPASGSARFKDYKPTKPELVHTWYAYPMESMMATTAKEARQVQVLEGLQRQAGVLHAGRLQNWLNWQRIFKALELRLQARADRPQGERRRAGAGHDRGLGDLHHGGPLACRPTGRRPRSAWTSGSSTRVRTRSPSSRRPGSPSSTSTRRAHSPRTSARRCCRACRSCSATTCAPICRRTSSTR